LLSLTLWNYFNGSEYNTFNCLSGECKHLHFWKFWRAMKYPNSD
jgi:hypothetical protein